MHSFFNIRFLCTIDIVIMNSSSRLEYVTIIQQLFCFESDALNLRSEYQKNGLSPNLSRLIMCFNETDDRQSSLHLPVPSSVQSVVQRCVCPDVRWRISWLSQNLFEKRNKSFPKLIKFNSNVHLINLETYFAAWMCLLRNRAKSGTFQGPKIFL